MIIPATIEELATYVQAPGRQVFYFKADWCGDCRFLEPALPEIEARYPEANFIQVDRDQFLAVAQEWGIFGIPSLVVLEDGQEIGRLVNKARKTKAEVIAFLDAL